MLGLHQAVVKRGGKPVLGPVDLGFDAHGFTILLGPNGSGKTTLLKVLHGVERLSSGRLDVQQGAGAHTQAYVFQSPIMLRRSVRQNLAYPLQLLGVGKPEIAAKVTQWATQIGLEEALDRPAPRLSGGEKQKLALARALIRTPKLLFLDEPCANLDGRSTREIEALLMNAHARGTRIIMTTHDLGQARRLATDVVFLLNGKLHDQGEAAAFFAQPSTTAASRFLQGDIVE